ncbi:PREDICTED: glutathione-specific gamma-glutamylcyclotransferase 1 isoform X1 [Nicrophorus vespilloides]|uniref:glutathione-specific gamma-glutamylcyclotransferase n=1 Tax=Nicrophorus vespilloides TaxID=110193 RepID=A0ABM1N7R1_NICVS|nr:PREDICTED: glutathione-specific gamma-glutamylcyclotransferase 1 isoform X1 [Nicrophorus vespilloides]XP_017782863.1 PREDICTED: glutathione-specific gamma-glutamylcyclotransferase 1 isoform X1 [Nicrophorus vespilloides]XP_017782864.1 PREDICTED: glutathione-specific gamma-glutamylcyclotransferase 1 isoform X1 [Nicrophorus vespilloides]XP_017782866.1 PREDICTED: glutathione-specific gamma-glutamylcyclotransferase 1 isoform X1 [Nicrophorus vespilloides]
MAEARKSITVQNGVTGEDAKACWIFGYGSICWKPDFDVKKVVFGSIRGYSRKFWQGNKAHRGTKDQLSRVATLVSDDKSVVHGVAFIVSDEQVIQNLKEREITLGGYTTIFTTFYPSNGPSFDILVYVAQQDNDMWLGDAPMPKMVDQIMRSKGPSGHNVEYVLRLAHFSKMHFPNIKDDHLYGLEDALMQKIQEMKLPLDSLMGDGKDCVTYVLSDEELDFNRHELDQERTNSFQYTTDVPDKKLRCLNI